MKKVFQSGFLLGIIALAFSSCTTSKVQSFDYDYLYINKQGIVQRPLVTDLEVGKDKTKLSRTYENVTVAKAKENIMGEFIQQTNADLIVQPYFSTSTIGSAYSATVTVSLTGYPAFYKNIRMYDPKDSSNFKLRAYINNEENKPLTSEDAPVIKKGKGWQTVGGIVLLGLLIAALAGGGA